MQEFKCAAKGAAMGLAVLHSNGGCHHDVRAPNICWLRNARHDQAVLVDLSFVGPSDRAPLKPLRGWTGLDTEQPDAGHTRTLNREGNYDTLSDMRQLGYMLKHMSDNKSWEQPSQSLCAALLAKQLDAQAALRHEYLRGNIDMQA